MTRIQLVKPLAVKSILAGAAFLIAAGLPGGASAGVDELRAVMEQQWDIAIKLGSTAAQEQLERAFEALDNLSIEEAYRLSGADRSAERLTPILQILNESLDETAASAAAAAALTPVPTGLSTPLTPPNYYNSCPLFGERNDTLTVFISDQALFAAETVREEASRACDETIVILGEGGNLSLVCLITDAIYIVAKEINNVLNFCDATVDAAEIEGAFERTADVFANLNEHHGHLSLHDKNLDEHDNNLAGHDTDIKELLSLLQGAVDENTRRLGETILLLHTPQGQRQSATPVCDGEPCTWNY